MKKGMILLVLIVAILLCSIMEPAFATGTLNFGGGQLGQGSWSVLTGTPSMSVKDGVIYAPSSSISMATHAVSVESGGSYACAFSFRIPDQSSMVMVGIGSSSGMILAGFNGVEFKIGDSGRGGSAAGSAEYTVRFTSVDDNSFNVVISGGGFSATQTVNSPMPTYVIIKMMNVSGTNGPIITSATFTSTAPSVSPGNDPATTPVPDDNSTVTPSPAAGSSYNPEIAGWYATYYEPPVLSNQSYIYDDDGQLIDVITGMPAQGVVVAAEPANATAPAIGNVTAQPGNVSTNVTRNSTMPTALAEATVPAATKTQSPGFGAVLAAISMVAAVLYYCRKK